MWVLFISNCNSKSYCRCSVAMHDFHYTVLLPQVLLVCHVGLLHQTALSPGWSSNAKYFLQRVHCDTSGDRAIKYGTTTIPTRHPQDVALKNTSLKNFKPLSTDLETSKLFLSVLPFVSFKDDKNIGNFLVRSER